MCLKKCIFLSLPQQDGRLWNWCRDVVLPPDVSIGLLSCNNLISQCHTSTGLWQHLMSVAVFSSVSNFMTGSIFYSMARSGLWTSNDNWEEKQCSAQLRTKSFCQEPKLWVYAYDCACVGLVMKIIAQWKIHLEMFYLDEVSGWGTCIDFKQKQYTFSHL